MGWGLVTGAGWGGVGWGGEGEDCLLTRNCRRHVSFWLVCGRVCCDRYRWLHRPPRASYPASPSHGPALLLVPGCTGNVPWRGVRGDSLGPHWHHKRSPPTPLPPPPLPFPHPVSLVLCRVLDLVAAVSLLVSQLVARATGKKPLSAAKKSDDRPAFASPGSYGASPMVRG
jgi:hypothetical protein